MSDDLYTITECTAVVMTVQGPNGESTPLVELRITAHPQSGKEEDWPPLRLPLYRLQTLTDMLQEALADARSRLQ